MGEDARSGWRAMDDAPKGEDILVYTKPWGPIIASYSEEFQEWLSRMQVPVSIKGDEELPTHWQPMPEPPESTEAADESGAAGTNEAAETPVRVVAG